MCLYSWLSTRFLLDLIPLLTCTYKYFTLFHVLEYGYGSLSYREPHNTVRVLCEEQCFLRLIEATRKNLLSIADFKQTTQHPYSTFRVRRQVLWLKSTLCAGHRTAESILHTSLILFIMWKCFNMHDERHDRVAGPHLHAGHDMHFTLWMRTSTLRGGVPLPWDTAASRVTQ